MKNAVRAFPLASLVILAWSNCAAAQEAPQSGAEATVEDIVVTATRREMSLQKVPISVSAITGDAISKSGISELRDLLQVVPGLNFVQSQQSAQPVIRGVTTTNAGVADESNVGIYIDGIYQPDALANNFDLLQIQRVEVLRGPQGTIFGRNATGGLINYITPDPSFDAHGEVSARYGRFDARQFRAYVTAPLTDMIAFDLSGIYYKDDGYIRDLVRNRTTGGRESKGVRAKLLFQPSEGVKFVLTGNYNNVKDIGVLAGQPYKNNTRARAPGNPPTILPANPFEVALEEETYIHPKQKGVALQTAFDLGFASLQTASSFQDNRSIQPFDADGSPLRLQRATTSNHSEYLSQEIRLISAAPGPLTWLAGVYGMWGKVDVNIPIAGNAPIQLIAPVVKTDAYAVFAEGTYSFSDALQLTVGSRYSWEKRRIDQDLTNYATNVRSIYSAKANFHRWTPRVAAQYRPSRELMLYASYSQGFKSGVYNITAPSPNIVEPERLTAYEIGFKADPTPFLRINGSIFYYDYKDLQVVARVGPTTTLLNAASAKPRGGELEATAKLSQDLKLRLGAAYVHARYSSFPNALVTIPTGAGGNSTVTRDVSGNRMLRAPGQSFNLGLNYAHEFDGGTLAADVSAYYSGRVYFDFLNRLSQAPYAVVNGSMSWAFPNGLQVGVWGRNLGDKTYAQLLYTTTLSDQIFYGRPREYGVSVGWKF